MPLCPLLKNGFLLVLPLFLVGAAAPAAGQQGPLGAFSNQAHLGGGEGTALYDTSAQAYTVWATGGSHLARRRMQDDFVLRTRLQQSGAPAQRKGWMVRSSLADTATVVTGAVHNDGRTVLRVRDGTDGPPKAVRVPVDHPDVLELKREGPTFILSAAQFGDPFTRDSLAELELGPEVHVGLFVSSEGEAEARFHNVRLITPAPDSLVPYEDDLGSTLETMTVETGRRTIHHRSPTSLQAPNWTPDGEALIYNSGGLLYRFDLATKAPEAIDTGFADANNNDHVISSDGTRLGISHHAEAHDGTSIIYTVPIEGGTPTQVTPKGPSYLHGWSPDDRFLVYTGERNGEYDLYKIPADGGEEIRLTTAEGLDDGSEYTPDGEYIYFNSVRSGSMEIWRMRPDGSHPEQLTDDRFNNWFPHVSPDGQTVVFLSYPPSVPPGDHPSYKHVYLRKMPIDGGTPEVIAYVYGGQGTINVPSWSPDGTQIGFVSNTGTH
ncbi:MAG: biopolymer transporter TolR [Bacteroidetes bacterium QS_3_64_15]|nr:MAG: biopolymer transporter TolR [Bacteroidetes bacterium QS_3_64_15]